MVLVEDLNMGDNASRSEGAPPFAEWLKTRFASGASALELLGEIGAGDEAGSELGEAEARSRLEVFALHPGMSRKACEAVRVRSLQRSRAPPFPFAVWLQERRINGATAEQVLRVLNMVPSANGTMDEKARWQGLQQLSQEEEAWGIVASMAKKARLAEAPPRASIFKFEGEEAVADLIAKSRRILVLVGAGISVSCGLPTFRDDDQRHAIAREF